MTKKETVDIGSFRGVTVASVTPFRPDGSVDRMALERHLEAQIEGGVDALLACGTTGESATMNSEEDQEVIAETIRVARGRVPVMAGAGSKSTREAVASSVAAHRLGADAILSVGPYYNKPTQEGFFQHFKAIAEAVDIPVFLYNVPGRTASNIGGKTILRIAEIDNVWGVKEASGDLDQVMTILRERPEGFLVLAGDDQIALPIMALGGDGVVSVTANEAPAHMAAMVSAALEGDFATAREAHYRLLPLMRANFVETNPIPVKTALEMMGRMEARFRLPLLPMTNPAHRALLRGALDSVGLPS